MKNNLSRYERIQEATILYTMNCEYIKKYIDTFTLHETMRYREIQDKLHCIILGKL